MSERRLLALLALLLGLLGALLVLLNFHFPRQGEDVVRWIGEYAVRIILALVAIGGSLLMYGAKQQAGGIINIIVGIALLLVSGSGLSGPLLIIFSGILGLVAAGSPAYYARR